MSLLTPKGVFWKQLPRLLRYMLWHCQQCHHSELSQWCQLSFGAIYPPVNVVCLRAGCSQTPSLATCRVHYISLQQCCFRDRTFHLLHLLCGAVCIVKTQHVFFSVLVGFRKIRARTSSRANSLFSISSVFYFPRDSGVQPLQLQNSKVEVVWASD